MKRCLVLLVLLSGGLSFAQSTNCNITVPAPLVSSGAIQNDNRINQCTSWLVSYYAHGFSGVSVELDGAPDVNGTPGTYAAIGGACVTSGSNPTTSTASGTLRISNCYYPWVKVSVTVTGTGYVWPRAYGQANPVLSVSGGGGSSAFSALTAGTNNSAAMVVGTGASISTSGTGTIVATSCPSCPAPSPPAFNTITDGTNITAEMYVDTGAFLSVGSAQSQGFIRSNMLWTLHVSDLLSTAFGGHPITGITYYITDGSTAFDCAVGGGINLVPCIWNGSSWQGPPANSLTTNAAHTTPTLCPTGQAPTGIDASFNATGCATIGGGSSTGKVYWFNHALTPLSLPTSTLTGVYGVNAATPSITRNDTGSGGSFITDGWQAGMQIAASGFTNAANNSTNQSWDIISVTAGVLTLSSMSNTGCSGCSPSISAMVTETAAAQTVTLTVDREELSTAPPSSAESDETISILTADGNLAIDSYVTPSASPGLTSIPVGDWTINDWVYVNSTTGGSTTVYYAILKVTPAGVETPLFDTSGTPTTINQTSYQNVIQTYTITSPITLLATDRIIVRPVFHNATALSKIIHHVYMGNLHAGFIVTTFPASGGGSTGITLGPIASLPVTVPASGNQYTCTDSPYVFISNGSAWIPFIFGYQVKQPILSAFTQVEVGLSTFDTSHGGIIQNISNAGNSTHVQVLSQNIPGSGAYYVDAAFLILVTTGQPNGGAGSGLSGGTATSNGIGYNNIGVESGAVSHCQAQLLTSTTSFSGNFGSSVCTMVGPLIWTRMYDDGTTNRTYFVSNNGYTWTQMYQESRTNIFTPAQAILAASPVNAQIAIHWVHFSIHT